MHDIKLSKVKAHSGVKDNERVDRLAKNAALTQIGDPYMWKTEEYMEEKRLGERGLEKKSWEF